MPFDDASGAGLLCWPLIGLPAIHLRTFAGDPAWEVHEAGAGIDFASQAPGAKGRLEWSDLGGGGRQLSGWIELAEGVIPSEAGITIALQGALSSALVQSSYWSNENQGIWVQAPPGGLNLTHTRGRKSEGGTPFVGILDSPAGHGLAVHLITLGNWRLEVKEQGSHFTPGGVTITAFLGEDFGGLPLKGRIDLPTLWFFPFSSHPREAAPLLHAALRTALPPVRRAPILYNTWYDQFENLEVSRLRRQLAAAKAAGCEVFVVDAGWFGADPNWYDGVGDWTEATTRSFHGNMGDFAEEVRREGLGFGIWMEAERVGPKAPIRNRHPEWIVAGNRLDLENPEARDYLKGEISRVLNTYKAVWIKLDSNFELGPDMRRKGLAGYFHAWNSMVNDLRTDHPHVYFEGCSSGALRCDLEVTRHTEAQYLSDNINPWEALSIYQGACLRLDPQRIGHWAVLYERGGLLLSEKMGGKSGAAKWEMVDLDFAVTAAMLGRLGFSGDLASLSLVRLGRIRQLVHLYKELEPRLLTSVTRVLGDEVAIPSRHGWMGFDHECRDGSRLIFVFRLGDQNGSRVYPVAGLDPGREYEARELLLGHSLGKWLGREWMEQGLKVSIADCNQAAIVEIT